MELELLLDYVSGLTEEEKAEVLDAEFNRQRAYVDAMCDTKRLSTQA